MSTAEPGRPYSLAQPSQYMQQPTRIPEKVTTVRQIELILADCYAFDQRTDTLNKVRDRLGLGSLPAARATPPCGRFFLHAPRTRSRERAAPASPAARQFRPLTKRA